MKTLMIILSLILLSCKSEPKKVAPETKNKLNNDRLKHLPLTLIGKTNREDYHLIIKGLTNHGLNLKLNRIKKTITIKIKGFKIKKRTLNINTGKLAQIQSYNEKNSANILIQLKRPLRYEIKSSGDDTLIQLRNYKNLSSILLINKEVIDFHYKTYNVDLHVDFTIHLFMKKLDFENGTPFTQADFSKIKRGGGQSLFYVIWVPDFFVKKKGKPHLYKYYFELFPQYFGEPYLLAKDLIRNLKQNINRNNEVGLALSVSDIINNRIQNKKSALMGMEGAHPLEGKIGRLQEIYNMGVRYLGITWSNSNAFGDAAGYNQHGGLSEKGKDLIREMMKIGMIIDVSHCSENTFNDIIDVTQYKIPVIASHSNVKILKQHKRNLSLSMLKKIKKSEGIIGVVYHSGFLGNRRQATIEDVLDQIDFITETIGVDYVALGSDFDGFIIPPRGLKDMRELPNLTLGLYNRGYTLTEIEKILGQNFLRVFKKVESLKVK